MIVMTQPGWYPDPRGGTRYWDGQQWTSDYQPDQTPKVLPLWALIGWWVLCVLGAVACLWFVLLMTAFGCDSGWEGCEDVAVTTLFAYAGVAAVGLIGLLIWGLLKPGTGVRVAVMVLMPCWVLASVVLAFVAYGALAQNALN